MYNLTKVKGEWHITENKKLIGIVSVGDDEGLNRLIKSTKHEYVISEIKMNRFKGADNDKN